MAALANIDQLVTSGLTSPRNLAYTRIILTDPYTGITSMVYRDLAIKLFGKITRYMLNDPILFQRLRTLLMSEPTVEDFLLDDGDDDWSSTNRVLGSSGYLRLAQKLIPGQSRLKTVRKAMKRDKETS